MLILLASGSVVGMLLGIAASRVLSAIVCQASAHDPFVLASVAFTIVARFRSPVRCGALCISIRQICFASNDLSQQKSCGSTTIPRSSKLLGPGSCMSCWSGAG
jgi:hypothetical protein